jgi:hypothetical protein
MIIPSKINRAKKAIAPFGLKDRSKLSSDSLLVIYKIEKQKYFNSSICFMRSDTNKHD